MIINSALTILLSNLWIGSFSTIEREILLQIISSFRQAWPQGVQLVWVGQHYSSSPLVKYHHLHLPLFVSTHSFIHSLVHSFIARRLSVAGPTDLNDITFRIVDQSRYPEVLELLYANFHPDEPMSRALNIYSGNHRVPAIDEYTLNGLKENLSLMAVDSFTNKLLGMQVIAKRHEMV